MKNDKKELDCHSTKKARRAYQKGHKPDFTAKDLWTYLAMNDRGVFVFGFDDKDEADAYVKHQKKRRRPCTLVQIDDALKMPFPPTWEHNWDFDEVWDFPKELEEVFGPTDDAPIVATNDAVIIR